MERPDFFTLKNGQKAKLPFSDQEYNQRVSKLRSVMDKSNLDSLRVEITYSLVIPCYNESENLVNLINRCKYLITEEENIEVVIVDNGSTDSTPKVLNDLLKNCKNFKP